MGVKEFFRPTKWKGLIMAIFVGLFFIGGYYGGFSPLLKIVYGWVVFLPAMLFPINHLGPGSSFIPLIPVLIYWYLLACTVVFLFTKFRKKKSTTGKNKR